jgi:hypothetical protein
MIDLRHGIARIGYVLLTIWMVGWVALLAWGTISEHTDWTAWPIFLAGIVGPPLSVFFLWRLLLWLLQGFIRPSGF